MNAASMLVALATYGVSFGWQPLPDGNTEYIVQIEPALAEAMIRNGDVISSVIPPEVQGVRRFRIQVGNEQLPRATSPKSAARRASGEQSLPEYSGYQRFASDVPDDDRRRWVMPDFTVPPDDPATARSSLEPYRPVTPFASDTSTRIRGVDFETPTSTFGARSPALGAEAVASIHGKPTITKADAGKVSNVISATNAATPLAAVTTDPAKQPWLPLTLTALLLFASLGANLYLGWLARDYYLRYREIIADDGPAII